MDFQALYIRTLKRRLSGRIMAKSLPIVLSVSYPPFINFYVPMKNFSTPLKTDGMPTSTDENYRRKPSPKKSTLAMLRQFARTYSCASSLPPTLGSFIAN